MKKKIHLLESYALPPLGEGGAKRWKKAALSRPCGAPSPKGRGAKIGVLLVILLWASPAFSQEPGDSWGSGTVRLEDLLKIAAEQNPSLEEARRRHEAAKQLEDQEGAFDDPMLGVAYTPRPNGMKGFEFELSQKIPFWGVRGLKREAARSEAGVAGAEAEARALDLAEDVKTVFHEWLLTRHSLLILHETRELLLQFDATASQRYRAGLAPQSDPLKARVEIARLEAMEEDLKSREAIAKAMLNTLLGRNAGAPLGNPMVPPLRVVELSEEDLVKIALEKRPEVAAVRAKLAGAEARSSLAKRSYWPDLEVGASYGPSALASDLAAQEEFDDKVTVRGGINIPLQLGKRSAAVEQGAQEILSSRAALQAIQNEIRFEVYDHLALFRKARRVLALYREKILPAARLELDASRHAYENNRTDFLALLDSERALQQALFEEAEALHAYYHEILDIERTVAVPLEELPSQPAEEGHK